jgi:hypothetical protein
MDFDIKVGASHTFEKNSEPHESAAYMSTAHARRCCDYVRICNNPF